MIMSLAQAQHFVSAPDWTWYILFYFFLAGLSGGSYVIATLFRLRGDRADEPVSRLGYYVAFVALLPCPLLLTLDLGKPLRFWHMMWNTTPGDAGLSFKYWSPMSVGVWALIIFGAFATVAFLEALVRDGKLRLPVVRLLEGALGTVVAVIGAVLGLFIAGYTGVLLAVSNQPVWSDTWALGGLFLASSLSGSAALLLLLLRYRQAALVSADKLIVSERLYSLLELVLIVLFALTLLQAGTFGIAFGFPWLLLWLVAFAGLAPGIYGLATSWLTVKGEEPAAPAHASSVATEVRTPVMTSVLLPALVLLGVLALRAAVIFSIH
ncbi:MAG: polysulfide reductase [Actinophytocola sp.]|nr:polysulfide reductase [Actinophytocola sp.]